MKIEPLITKDLNHLALLQPDGWPDIKPGLQFYLSNSFCHVIKIGSQTRIMGIGAGIVFGRTAWLAHIIVDKEFRGRGLAHKIVAYLLEKLRAFRCESISLIATDMGYPIYERSGFQKQTDYVFLKRETPLSLCDEPENITAFSGHHHKEVLELDHAISGEDRSRILTGKLGTAFLYRENSNTIGIYLPDLGEGMIIASNTRAGIELMKKKYATVDKAVLPVENKAGIQFLMENGFTETLRAARMIWGKPFSWQPENIYSRIAGKLG